MKKSKYVAIILLLLFMGALYLTETSSAALAKYNQGYGTFDMKSYDTAKVYQVLDQMEPKGFDIYQSYFVGDFLFIFVFAAVQIALLLHAFRWLKNKGLISLLLAIPFLRGLFDSTENILLLYVLNTYPQHQDKVTELSSKITSIKLALVVPWLVLVILGYVITFVKKKQEK